MSSLSVRTKLKDFIDTNLPTEKVVDLTAEFREMREMLDGNSIGRNDPWIGLQFIGNEEIPVSLSATNSTGKYREIGVLYLHVVGVAKLNAGAGILTRCETIRNLFRGRNIDGVRIEAVSPPNFEAGATLQFESGWTSASILIEYEYDIDL